MLIPLLVFAPFGYALITYIIGRRHDAARDVWAIVFTCVELALALLLINRGGAFEIGGVLALGLRFKAGGVHTVYAVITAFMWAFTTIFARQYFAHEREGLNRYHLFSLMTLGATEGVMLSADLMTAFTFFEILSFTSFTWVIHEQTPDAVRAGYTYLFIAVIGGLVLLMGLLMIQDAAGTLEFEGLRAAAAAADGGRMLAGGICVLLGFGAKAGMFPLHVWLPKAHPVAPSPASALLSGVLTKVGVYGILMLTLNALGECIPFGRLLLWLGIITMALGAVLALFSVNLKRTLACSSMSQVGFILVGIAMSVLLRAAGAEEGETLSICGAYLHMVNHSLIKLTLFMAAGVVVMNIEKLNLNDMRGWGRNKPLIAAAFALGALGISGVPLFNGYISKTLLHEGIVEGIAECAGMGGALKVMEWIFLCSGGLTFAYMLKLFICLFIERNSDAEVQARFDGQKNYVNAASGAVLLASAVLMVLLGQPAITMRLAYYISGRHEILEFAAFTWGNLKGGLISLSIGAAVYLIVVRRALMRGGRYLDRWPKWLDLENGVYRPLLTKALPAVFGEIAAVFGENKLLKPVCRLLLRAAKGVAGLFDENRVLAPLAKALTVIGTIIARALTDSLDAVVVLLRKTVVRENRVRDVSRMHVGKWYVLREEAAESARPLFQNFSFALLMTCVGILLILGTLIYVNLVG